MASINIAATWDVRAAGSDTNGAFYVPGASGVNYSAQNSAQYALSNGVANGTATIATTSAASDMVGNGVYIAGGTGSITATWREIVSVVVGVSITVNDGTGLTTGTGVTLNIGGSAQTLSAIYGFLQPGNVVYTKGTLTGTSVLLALTGTPANTVLPLRFIGYGTTQGDGVRSTWTSATNSVDIVTLNVANGVQFQNIYFSSTAGTRGTGINALTGGITLNISCVNCMFDGLKYGIKADFSSNWTITNLVLERCEIKNCTSDGIFTSGGTWLSDVSIHDCAGMGFNVDNATNSFFVLSRVRIYKNGGPGWSCVVSGSASGARSLFATNCDFSQNTGAGIVTNSTIHGCISDCIFDRNTTYGIDEGTTFQADNPCLVQRNLAFYSNTTAKRRNLSPGLGDVTLTADPYTDVSTSDLTLNANAGGGAACRGAGVNGADIGAFQSAGGTTGMLFVRGLAGGFE